MTTILFAGLLLYVAMGLVIGLAFVIFGVTRVQPATITVGGAFCCCPAPPRFGRSCCTAG
jgi:hypothetical protein